MSGLVNKLNDIQSEVNSLLTFANEKTGNNDTTLGDAINHLLSDGIILENVFKNCIPWSVSETHQTSSYEYACHTLITSDYMHCINDDNIHLFYLDIKNSDGSVHYTSLEFAKNCILSNTVCINDINGECNNSKLIFLEYRRGEYNILYRATINRSSVTVYEGEYIIEVRIFKLKEI